MEQRTSTVGGLVTTFVELMWKYDTDLMARAFGLSEGEVLRYLLTPVAHCSDIDVQRGRDGVRSQLKFGHRHIAERDLYTRLRDKKMLLKERFDDGQFAIFFSVIAERRYPRQMLEEQEVSQR